MSENQTAASIAADDTEYETNVLERCTVHDLSVDVTMANGIGFGFKPGDGFVAPEPGCKVRVYPKLSLGVAHRGVLFENPDGSWQVGYYLTAEQARARDVAIGEECSRFLDEQRRSPIPPTGHAKYEWRPGMGEISGFGGAYEGACRKMVAAGCQYLDENPDGELTFGGFLSPESDRARGLDSAVLASCPDCSGAMLAASIRACVYVNENGWEAYCAAMTMTEGRDSNGIHAH